MDVPGYIKLTGGSQRKIMFRYSEIAAFGPVDLVEQPLQSFVQLTGGGKSYMVCELAEEIADLIDTQISRDRAAG